jgi:hypothetical protein
MLSLMGGEMTRTKASEVRTDLVLPLPARQACDRLVRILAMERGVAPLRLVVGPRRGSDFPAKQVLGTVRGPLRRASTYLFELHWEPTGATAAAYPTLDATLGITTIDTTGSLLSVVAHYSPPFGTAGAIADRAAMSRVANATVTSVLHRLAHAITHAAGNDLVGV